MAGEQRQYLAYLLRLWQVRSAERLVWRASLQDPRTGERLGFASLAQLVAFLEQQIGSSAPPGEECDSPSG